MPAPIARGGVVPNILFALWIGVGCANTKTGFGPEKGQILSTFFSTRIFMVLKQKKK